MIAKATEAHEALWNKLYNLAFNECFGGDSSDGPALKLIMDSEAAATAKLRADVATLKYGPIQGHRDEIARLNAEVERLRITRDATCIALAGELRAARAEVDARRERVTWEAVDQCSNNLARSLEDAEAILSKLQELHGCSREMVVHWCEHAAKRSLGLDKVQAELAELITVNSAGALRLAYLKDQLKMQGNTSGSGIPQKQAHE